MLRRRRPGLAAPEAIENPPDNRASFTFAVAAWAVAVLALTLGASLLLLGLLWLDVVLAPFCLEMTYPALLCWALCPLAVAVNYMSLILT